MASQTSLSPHQKVSLVIFIVIGMATLVLGAAHIGRAIDEPLRRKGTATFKSAEELEMEQDAALRAADTDRDGLSDYDELRVFRTSPFLEDSDSDGDHDGAEVAAESDPNCPKGRTCRQAALATGGTAGSTGTAGSGASGETTQPALTPEQEAAEEQRILSVITRWFGNPEALTPEGIRVSIAQMSGTEIRDFLTELGVPPAALQKADDGTLRQLVQETLAEIAAQSSASGTQTAE